MTDGMQAEAAEQGRKALVPWVIALAVVLLAFAARVAGIFELPPGLSNDEAANLIDIVRVLDGGNLPLYFEANNGREPLFIYMQLLLVMLLGPASYPLRLASALVGALTVVVAYRFTMDLFGRSGDRISTWAPPVAGFLLATSLWHVNLSRIGLRAISLPLLLMIVLLLFWRGYTRRSRAYLLASGIFAGLSLYTYIASRLVPLVPVVFILSRRLWLRSFARLNWYGVVLASAGFVVAAGPLAFFALSNPHVFWNRATTVSSMDPGAPPIWDSMIKTLGMFVWEGSAENIFGLDGRPVFDWPMGLAFLAGLAIALRAVWLRRGEPDKSGWLSGVRPEACLLVLITLAAMASPSFFSFPAPHFLRAVGASPVVYIFPAVAIGVLAGRLFGLPSRPWRLLGNLVLVSVILWSGSSSLWNYFSFVNSEKAYYDFDGDKMDMGAYIKDLTGGSSVYVYADRRIMEDGTIRAMTSGAKVIPFDSRHAVAFPPGPVEYVLKVKDAHDENFGRYFGPDVEPVVWRDARGQEALAVFRIDGGAVADYHRSVPAAPLFWANQPPREPASVTGTSIAGEIALRGYGIAFANSSGPAQTGTIHPGQPFRAVLAWEALKRPSLSYHVSVKVLDATGKAWAQKDSATGGNQYPTDRWKPGEWIYDTYDLTLDTAAPPGSYHLEVTVYDLRNLGVFPVLSAGGQPVAQRYLLGDVQAERR